MLTTYTRVSRYVALAALVGMLVAYYVTHEVSVPLVGAFLALAGGSEGLAFVRDVMGGK